VINLTRKVLSLASLLCVAQPASATLFLVTESYDAVDVSPGDRICADASGRCTLRAAVQESNALSGADIIILPSGTYTLSIPGNAEHAAVTGDLDLLSSITVRGQGADRTIIDAGGIDRAFEAINAGTVVIENLTIENGVAGANTPGYFAFNTGGAISTVGNSSTLTLNDVVLRNNQAVSGGGLYNVYSTVVINNSVLYDNTATTGSGGGIAEGLAAYTRLYNVTLSGNRAAQNGGGMITSNNTAQLYNVTITGNLADSDANGTGNGGGLANGITAATVRNSIVAGNSDSGGEAPDCTDALISAGYNLLGNNLGCSMPPAAGDQIGTPVSPLDPELLPLTVAENGVPMHALAATSPAIDSANPAVPGSGGDACMADDARGAGRTINTPCDIGAYEIAVFGRTFLVNSLEDRIDASPGDGICETGAGNQECTLRAAIQESNVLDGMDIIELPAGTYVLTRAGADEDLSVSGDLDIVQGTRIVGAGMSETIIDGGGLDRVFHMSTAERVEIQGLTIRNGAIPTASGGGILLANTGGLDLTDVQITGNSAQSGGGVYASLWSWMNDGMVNLTRCGISSNSATQYGGGFANFTFRVTKMDATTLSGNSASTGGGIFNSFMSLALIKDSTISANTAQSGGGIGMLFGNGVITLVNTTLSGNRATLSGGGINGGSSDLISLFSSTVTTNRAAGMADGGGVFSTGPVWLSNTVLAGNTDDDVAAPDCAATVTSYGYNFIGNDAGCVVIAAAGDQVGTAAAPRDPRLELLAIYSDAFVAYHRPFDDSPLLNAGNPAQPGSVTSSCPVNDLRGVDRVLNAPCDIGAVERRRADVAVSAVVEPNTVVRAGQMDYAIQVTNAGPDVATGLSLALTPASGSSYVSVDAVGWSCNTIGSNVVCQGADLPSGAISGLLLKLSVPDSSGTMTSVMGVASDSWDANASNNAIQVSFASNAPPVIAGLADINFSGEADTAQIAATLTLTDIDNPIIQSATVQFIDGFVSGEDILFLSVYSGLTANWDAVNGILTITGAAPVSTYQTVLRSIRYTNQSGTATEGDRQIRISVSDGIFENVLASLQLSLPAAVILAETASSGVTRASTMRMDTDVVPDESAVSAVVLNSPQEATPAQESQPAEDSAEETSAQDTQDTMSAMAPSSGGITPKRKHSHSVVSVQHTDGHYELEVASIASAEFMEEISTMREQMAAYETHAEDAPQQIIMDTAKTMTLFLFAGATNWYLKGSTLLASLFTSLPLWTRFDPLPILALNRRMRRRRQRAQAAAAALEVRYSPGITRLLDARSTDKTSGK